MCGEASDQCVERLIVVHIEEENDQAGRKAGAMQMAEFSPVGVDVPDDDLPLLDSRPATVRAVRKQRP